MRVCNSNVSIMGGCHLSDHDSQWRTMKCNDPLYIWTNQCLASCQTESFSFGASCQKCSSNCSQCYGPTSGDCQVCAPGYAFNFQGVCISQCSATQYGTQSAGCSTCNSNCQSCLDGFDNGCSSCPVTSSLVQFAFTMFTIKSGYCVAAPDQSLVGFYRDRPKDMVVLQCPVNCKSCRDRYFCTSCVKGYNIYPPAASGALYQTCI